MKAAGYRAIFNYGPPRSQKEVNSKDRTIVVEPGVNPAPTFVTPGINEGKFGQETHPYFLIVDNLEASLATTVYKACGNENRAIV